MIFIQLSLLLFKPTLEKLLIRKACRKFLLVISASGLDGVLYRNMQKSMRTFRYNKYWKLILKQFSRRRSTDQSKKPITTFPVGRPPTHTTYLFIIRLLYKLASCVAKPFHRRGLGRPTAPAPNYTSSYHPTYSIIQTNKF